MEKCTSETIAEALEADLASGCWKTGERLPSVDELRARFGAGTRWGLTPLYFMKDDIFDYPLTVKVRLPDGWKSAKATQGGRSVPVRFVSHDGAPYALVEAVPDKGTVAVVRGR